MITSLMDVFTHEEHERDFITNLSTFCIWYSNNIITGHLNINSSKINFNYFCFDWLQIRHSFKKWNESWWPTSQFLMSGYFSVYRLDRNNKAGRIMLFFKITLFHFLWTSFVFQKRQRCLCKVKSKTKKIVNIQLLQSSKNI